MNKGILRRSIWLTIDRITVGNRAKSNGKPASENGNAHHHLLISTNNDDETQYKEVKKYPKKKINV